MAKIGLPKEFYNRTRKGSEYPYIKEDFIDSDCVIKNPNWRVLKEIPDETDPRDICERHLWEDFMLNLLKTLTERERKVIYCRFWLTMLLEETGKLFGVSRERIRSIEAKALRKLRHRSRKDTIPDQEIWSWVSLEEKAERKREKEEQEKSWEESRERHRKEWEEKKRQDKIFFLEQEGKRVEKTLSHYRKWDGEKWVALDEKEIKERAKQVAYARALAENDFMPIETEYSEFKPKGPYWNPYNK